jgi:hypothetical protein
MSDVETQVNTFFEVFLNGFEEAKEVAEVTLAIFAHLCRKPKNRIVKKGDFS